MRKGLTPTAALLLLAGVPGAADAQDSACRSEVERLAVAFFPESQAAQDQDAPLASGGSLAGPLENAPGARKGATMGEEERGRLQGLIREAIEAADEGDEQGCIQQLAEARVLVREAGIGSGGSTPPVPDTATGDAATGVPQGAGRPTGEAVDREADLGAPGRDAVDSGAVDGPGTTGSTGAPARGAATGTPRSGAGTATGATGGSAGGASGGTGGSSGGGGN